MTLTRGDIRENHVVEFEEGRRIAWTPAEPGGAAWAPVAVGTRAGRHVSHAGNPHLRLDPADR